MATDFSHTRRLTLHTVIALCLAIIFAFVVRHFTSSILLGGWLRVPGELFLRGLFMLVIPIIITSMVCGASQLSGPAVIRSGLLAIALYLLTTVIAVSLSLLIASHFPFYVAQQVQAVDPVDISQAPSAVNVLISTIPKNIFRSMAEGDMLPIVVFSTFLGLVLATRKHQFPVVMSFFEECSKLLIAWIQVIIQFAPIGVFFLVAFALYRTGADLLYLMLQYFMLVAGILLLHALGTYAVLIKIFTRLSLREFYSSILSVATLAFGVSSSVAVLPITLQTVQERLKVPKAIAALTIPLGATINMDGTAIMQGVATIFIAHTYGISLSLMHYLMIISLSTLASIGTAGVPSAGLVMLAMVLEHIGLPASGIALIIGVDRLLDMCRTAVNVTGDALVACAVSHYSNKRKQGVCVEVK